MEGLAVATETDLGYDAASDSIGRGACVVGAKSTSDAKTVRPLKEASILVVEDQSFVLDILERILRPKVGGLHGARSAEDAFYNLEKTPHLAHVAIVDYHLPGMNGARFIEKLRASKITALKTLPVVMMTGENNMDVYREAARLGIAAYLVKPVASATLTQALESALAGHKVPVPRIKGDPAAAVPSSLKRAAALPAREESSQVKEVIDAPAPPPELHDPIDFKA